MSPQSFRPLATLAASWLSLLAASAAHADPVIIWQNGFESADNCAWGKASRELRP